MRVFGQPGPGVVWNKNGVYSNITARLKSKEKFQFRQRPSLQIDRFLSTFNDATMEAIGIDKSTAGEIAKIRHEIDPPPLKWSDLRYVFDIQEDCNGKEAIQA
jgi:hypothetical protein